VGANIQAFFETEKIFPRCKIIFLGPCFLNAVKKCFGMIFIYIFVPQTKLLTNAKTH